MSKEVVISDHISSIREILRSKASNKREQIRRLIYSARKINNRHLYRCSVDQTTNKILEPQWLKSVSYFDLNEWKKTANLVWKKAAGILGSVPAPELLLFPGLGRLNGRVYLIDKRPVIGCSPDFPRCTGKNLKVLLAHEYAHFLRWRKTGIPSDNVPVYAMLYEEGWATWFSAQILSDFTLNLILMSNLHRAIDRPDPEGGYLSWCRRNKSLIIKETLGALRSKTIKDLGRLFQGLRLKSSNTPIRTGYFLGHLLLDTLSNELTPAELMNVRPTTKKISNWLNEL